MDIVTNIWSFFSLLTLLQKVSTVTVNSQFFVAINVCVFNGKLFCCHLILPFQQFEHGRTMSYMAINIYKKNSNGHNLL